MRTLVELNSETAEEDLSRQFLLEKEMRKSIQGGSFLAKSGMVARIPSLTALYYVTEPVSLAFLSARNCLL
jgi:hypothetical protein